MTDINQTQNEIGIYGFSQVDVTIIFADLRGFTAISSEYPPDIVIQMLNRFFSTMTEIIVSRNGTVDKFIGDSIMATFGAPRTNEDDLQQALACAVEMQIAMDIINSTNRALQLPSLFMGIGINTGQVMAGWLGSELHSEFTVIGDSVNLASRIESFSLRGQILIGATTYEKAADFIKTGEPMDIYVKGKATPVAVHEVLAIPSLDLHVPNRESRRSQRVRVNLPFSFQRIDHKIIMDEVSQGTIVDISYHGIQAELMSPAKAFEDIKFSLDLSLIGCYVADIYGKILRVFERDGKQIAAIEFTSVTMQNELNIRQFVQILLQGCEKAQ